MLINANGINLADVLRSNIDTGHYAVILRPLRGCYTTVLRMAKNGQNGQLTNWPFVAKLSHRPNHSAGKRDRDFNPLQSSRPPKAAESSAGPKALQNSWPKAKISAASEAIINTSSHSQGNKRVLNFMRTPTCALYSCFA